MVKCILKITLKSESIFNSGEEEQNSVNDKVLADEDGFVYFHAKTLKGQLRKQAKWLETVLAGIKGEDKINEYKTSVVKLFGSEYGNREAGGETSYSIRGIMALSNLELDRRIRDYFKAINGEERDETEYRITPYDMIEAQTNIRTRIQIDKEGVAEDRRMMTYHAVKDGLVFYSDLNFLEELNNKDIVLLNAIVNSLDSIGSSTNRGRGKVKAELLNADGQSIEAENLEVLFNE